MQYIHKISKKSLPQTAGHKANNLWILNNLGFKIPKTYCCTWDAYCHFQENDERVLNKLQDEIAEIIDLKKSYAIRSSTDLEDRQQHTYAGQFSTFLDVEGRDSMIQAIQKVWESTQLDGIRTYQERKGEMVTSPKTAVILQEMVTPLLSGVTFSKNPITGEQETIVEAVEGHGTALVQEGITPLRWVSKWGNWQEQPTDKEAFKDLIQMVVDQTKQISQVYGKEVDLEWVYDGEDIFWVQLREITALQNIQIYSNKISKEFLPGMIKPLIWSVNVPLINSVWVELLTELIGKNDIKPESLARAFYYRAYFDTGTFGEIFDRLGLPRQALEINMGIIEPPTQKPAFKLNAKVVFLFPRILRFLYSKWNFSKEFEQHFPEIETNFIDISQQPVKSLIPQVLLEKIDQLYNLAQSAAYYNIVVPLLMNAYNRAMQGLLKRFGVQLDQFDLTKDLTSLDAYAPDTMLEILSTEFNALDTKKQVEIRTSDYRSFQQLSGIDTFQENVSQFLEQFGHLSDSGNDFSVHPWRENPDLILNLITSYTPPEKQNIHKMSFDELPLRGFRRWITGIFYERARKYLYYRERVSSTYTFGYGLLRNYYLALADHFIHTGLLENREEIFFLYDNEIRQVVAEDIPFEEIKVKVASRRSEMQQYKDIDLPAIIYGDQPPPIVFGASEKMKGTPTSRGIYTGSARVVRGLQDFNKVVQGDVLVIPYSDVGWTPLFSKAGAIIAEAGGILSHSSIIAREYNIPAVVSVGNASRIEDNTIITVDGYRGEILFHKEDIN